MIHGIRIDWLTCEAKRPHVFHTTKFGNPHVFLENLPHMRKRVRKRKCHALCMYAKRVELLPNLPIDFIAKSQLPPHKHIEKFSLGL